MPGCRFLKRESYLSLTPTLTLAQTLAAGYMGNEYLSAQSIIMQFAMYTILLPFSIGVAGMLCTVSENPPHGCIIVVNRLKPVIANSLPRLHDAGAAV